MHEYSVVQSFIEMCEEYAQKNQCEKILNAKIKIGILSGIELELFKRALQTFKEGSVLESAEIEYIIEPLIFQCHQCQSITTTNQYHLQCHQCQSNDVKILGGEEMTLMHLEME